MATLSLRPNVTGALLSHHIRSVSREMPDGRTVTDHIAVFDYPDCIREFDGTKWTVKAKPEPTNLFAA